MYNFPLRKAMKETYKCNKDKSQSISSTNKSSNRDEGTNEFGHGALHRAVINDEERTIQRLVGNGIDVSEEDSLGFTAHRLAIILGKDYLIPYLDGETVENDEIDFLHCSLQSSASLSNSSSRRRNSTISLNSSVSSISSIREKIQSLLQKERSRTYSNNDFLTTFPEKGSSKGCSIPIMDLNHFQNNSNILSTGTGKKPGKEMQIINLNSNEDTCDDSTKSYSTAKDFNKADQQTVNRKICNRKPLNKHEHSLVSSNQNQVTEHSSSTNYLQNTKIIVGCLPKGGKDVTKEKTTDLNNNNNNNSNNNIVNDKNQYIDGIYDELENFNRRKSDLTNLGSPLEEIATPIKTTVHLTAQQFAKEFVDDKNSIQNKRRDPIKNVNKRNGQTQKRLRKSLSWPLIFSEFEQRMEEWEVWDLAVEETNGTKETKEQLGDEALSTSVDEFKEGKLEHSTRVSVRTSVHGSSQDLSRNSPSPLEEVKITYVFKERTKSSENLLTQSFDQSSRRTKASFRQSLRERLSLNFSNNNNKEKQHEKNESVYGNSLTVNENQTNMISRSKSMDCLQSKGELCFPFEENHASVGQTKRHFSATRSDLTSVGVHSDDDDDDCNRSLNVFTDSDEILNVSKPSLVHSSTPKKAINRSKSYTDITRSSKSKSGEEIYLLSVPNLSINKSKSVENIHKMDERRNVERSASKSPQPSPVLRRRKARTYTDSFRIDSGYFSPDDLRKDSAASSTSALEVNTPYTITFTPEKSKTKFDTNKPAKPSIKQGLVSILPIGVGEAMMDEPNTSNVVHNAESAHSVEEHGTFNLAAKRDNEIRLSFTEEEEYIDIDYIIEEKHPTLDSCDEPVCDTNEERDDKKVVETIEHNEEYRNFEKELDDKRHETDETDCPKYRNKTPPLLTVNIQSPESEEHVEESEEHVEKNEDFTIMHSTCPEVNNDEPSFENCDDLPGGNSSSSPERHRTLSNNECNSPFEDSINSFEAHEREYANCNGTPSTEEEEEYGDWENLGDHRRMTFVLLDYLPPIAEEDKPAPNCSNETKEDQKDDQSNDTIREYPRTLSAENLRIHNQENGEDTIKKNILEDFLSTEANSTSDQGLHGEEIQKRDDSNGLDVADTVSCDSKIESDHHETIDVDGKREEGSAEEKVEEKIVVEEVSNIEVRPSSIPASDVEVPQTQPEDVNSSDSDEISSAKPDREESTQTIDHLINDQQLEQLGFDDTKEEVGVAETENELEGRPPSPPIIVVDLIANDHEDDDGLDMEPASDVLKRNIDFNSRYSLTFSDLDSDGEEKGGPEQLLLDEIRPAADISILMKDVRLAKLNTRPDITEESDIGSVSTHIASDTTYVEDKDQLKQDDEKLFDDDEPSQNLLEVYDDAAVAKSPDYDLPTRVNLEDAHREGEEHSESTANLLDENNELIIVPLPNSKPEENVNLGNEEMEKADVKENDSENKTLKADENFSKTTDDETLISPQQPQIQSSACNTNNVNRQKITIDDTDCESPNSEENYDDNSADVDFLQTDKYGYDSVCNGETIDLTHEDEDEEAEERYDKFEDLLSSKNNLIHIPKQDTIERALQSNHLKDRSVRRESSLAWDDFLTSYQDDDDYSKCSEDSDSPLGSKVLIEDVPEELFQNETSTITSILQNIQDVDQCSQLLNEKISKSTTYTDFYIYLSSQKGATSNKHGFKLYTILSHGKCLCSFKQVINDFLCYFGLIKSEHSVQRNVNVGNILVFFTDLISSNDIDVASIQMFVYFLIKPSKQLNQYSTERLELITACFHSEMRYLLEHRSVTVETTIRSAFQKICIYFVHLDKEKSKELIDLHVVPKLNALSIDSFVLDVFIFMGVLKSEKPVMVTANQTAPLLMLDYVLEEFPNLPKCTCYLLLAFLGEQVSWKYQFSNKSRKLLYNKLSAKY